MVQDIKLSNTERRVLKLICKKDNEIASFLTVTPAYIRFVQNRIKVKLNARTRAEVAIKACQMGLIDVYDIITKPLNNESAFKYDADRLITFDEAKKTKKKRKRG